MLNTFLRRSLLGVALAGLMVTGAAAQSPTAQDRSNKGAAATGDARVDQVKSENAEKKKSKKEKKSKKDKDHNPDNDTNKGHHTGETKGNAKGHRH